MPEAEAEAAAAGRRAAAASTTTAAPAPAAAASRCAVSSADGVELDERRAAVLDEREAVAGLPAERRQQRLDRPAPAAADRAQLGRRRDARALQPAPDRRRDDGRAQLAAEGVGRDEDREMAGHRARRTTGRAARGCVE